MNNICVWDHLVDRDVLSCDQYIVAIACSHNGQLIACADEDCIIHLFNTKSGKVVYSLSGHTDTVTSLNYSKDDKLIASATLDGTVRIWNTETGQQIKDPFLKHNGSLFRVCLSPDGSQIAYNDCDEVGIHKIESSQELTLKGHKDVIYSFAYLPNGKCLITCGNDSTIRIWNTNTGKQLRVIHFEEGSAVYYVSLSSNGKTLGLNHRNRVIRIWDMHKSKLISRLHYFNSPSQDLFFSPNGEFFLLGSHEKQIQFWNIINRQSIKIAGDYDDMYLFKFSPDGKYIVSASGNVLTVQRVR